MLDERRGEVTKALIALSDGDTDAPDRLVALVYDELREIASAQMRNERTGHTLQPTALVHEAYVRLLDREAVQFDSRAHFFGAAARAMRHVLVDHARRRLAAKRGGSRKRVSLGDTPVTESGGDDLVDAVDAAFERLQAVNERAAQTVELRFFGGLTVEQGAEVMGVSERTVKRSWSFAKAWLYRELSDS